MVRWTQLGTVALVLSAAACGGSAVDESAKGAGCGAPGVTSSTTTTATGGTSESDSTTSGNTSGTCTAGAVNMDDLCEVCVVKSCTQEALACCQHEGCLDVIACAQKTGCDGVNCYAPDTCQKEIDAAGGPSVALEFASPLGECALGNCADACGQ